MPDLAALKRIVNLSSAANDFLVYTNALMAGRFQPTEALSYAPGASDRVKEILAKGGVAAGSTTGSYWGETAVGYREISSGFSASLAALSPCYCILAAGAFSACLRKREFRLRRRQQQARQ